MRLRTPAPGSAAALFLSASVTALALGLVVFFRSDLTRLLGFPQPAGTILAIWLFSMLLGPALWGLTHLALGRRAQLGTLQGWTWLFLAALAAGVLIAGSSLGWGTLLE